MKQELKCKDKVKHAFESRMKDIRQLFYSDGLEEDSEEIIQGDTVKHIRETLGVLNEYGLCIDKVEAGTFKGQREDYIIYQLSWGGPSEEFRIYKNGDVEFWFLDWWEGACVQVYGEDADIIKEIVSFVEF